MLTLRDCFVSNNMEPAMVDFHLFAHRGAKGHEPENTLAAFAKALDLGAKWIETDVYLVENELVVIHDDRLERTTNGTGYVTESSLEYLRSLDAGKGQRIPFLTEVLDLIEGKAGINIELKGPGTAARVASLINQTLAKTGWRRDQFIVSSFDHPELLAFVRTMPEIRVGVLTANIPLGYAEFAEPFNAWSIHASMEFVNREFVEDAHRRGKKVFVYTVNHPDDYARLRKLDVDGVFSDFPDRFLASR
jgi:glycerophosphoryl diester phosphodiesterase